MNNVEIGVAAATATLSGIKAVVRAVVRVFADVLPVSFDVVTPISSFLRQGRCSMSAIPGDNYFMQGGVAASV